MKPHAPAGASSSESEQQPAEAGHEDLGGLLASPEFLIRRAHQIASAAFSEACSDLDLTPSQYAALFALRQRSGVGQNELGRLIALDRSTTSLVVRSLRERGLARAHGDRADRRKSLLEITNKGRLLLAQAEQLSARASKSMMAVFTEQQASDFLAMLRLLNDATAHRAGDL